VIVVSAIDRAALPAALLPVAKQHMRITWATEDDYVKLCVARAIDMVERHSGCRIFKIEATWTPLVAGNAPAYQIPFQPVSTTFIATLPDSTVVTTSYQIVGGPELIAPIFMHKKDGGAFDGGVYFALIGGYTDEATIPPQFLDPILRIAAHLYEHRESVDTSGYATIPQWANDLLMGNWIPRC